MEGRNFKIHGPVRDNNHPFGRRVVLVRSKKHIAGWPRRAFGNDPPSNRVVRSPLRLWQIPGLSVDELGKSLQRELKAGKTANQIEVATIIDIHASRTSRLTTSRRYAP